MIKRVHHIGIIVKDIGRAAAGFQNLLGLPVDRVEEMPGDHGLRIAFIPVGDVLIELIQPLTDRGPNAEFLRTHGEGLQHIALAVDDVAAGLARVQAGGARTQHVAPVGGAGNTRIAFLNATDFGGCLLELCQPPGPLPHPPTGEHP